MSKFLGLVQHSGGVWVGGAGDELDSAGREREKTSTCSLFGQAVSTVKKSQASVITACWRRNARQLIPVRCGAGGSPAALSNFRTAVAETAMAELLELADDSLVASGRILACEPKNELAQLRL